MMGGYEGKSLRESKRKSPLYSSQALICTFEGQTENVGEGYAYWRSGGDIAATEYQGTKYLR
jgi:hypothetical protein